MRTRRRREAFPGEDSNTSLSRPLRERPAGPHAAWGRRRRSNRPGNSQANGPQGDETLESRRRKGRDRHLTEDVTRPMWPRVGRGIFQVPRQRGRPPETRFRPGRHLTVGEPDARPTRSQTNAPRGPARRARRRDGRTCGFSAARILRRRDHRTPPRPRRGGAVRRLPHGSGGPPRRRLVGDCRITGAGRPAGRGTGTQLLHRADQRRRRHHRRRRRHLRWRPPVPGRQRDPPRCRFPSHPGRHR